MLPIAFPDQNGLVVLITRLVQIAIVIAVLRFVNSLLDTRIHGIQRLLLLLIRTVHVVLQEIILCHPDILRLHPVGDPFVGIGSADNRHQLLLIGVKGTGICRLSQRQKVKYSRRQNKSLDRSAFPFRH